MFQYAWFIPLLFFAVRLMMVITMPLDGLLGFGDLRHFYNLAQMGLPFIDYWVEFPPVFPFISYLLYMLAGIREHAYFYMLVIILSIAQAVTIYVFIKLCGEIHQGMAAVWRIFLYTLISLGLSYGWWYFDPLAVLFTLLGIYFVVKGRDSLAGWALAAGILVKFFPLLVIPAVWRFREVKRALRITLIAIGISALMYLGLYLISPENTAASLGSQLNKGSWETVWALLDGNYNTGNFGPLHERLDAYPGVQFAGQSRANIPAHHLDGFSPGGSLALLSLPGWMSL